MKAGEFRADLDPTVVVYGLLGMLNWLYKWYDPNGRLGPHEIAAQFSSLALAGLSAAPPPVPLAASRPPRASRLPRRGRATRAPRARGAHGGRAPKRSTG